MNFEEKFKVAINLQRPNMVRSLNTNDNIGTWTMVYDEGFEFKIKNYEFFAFSKYIKKEGTGEPNDDDNTETSGYKSICDKTFLGN